MSGNQGVRVSLTAGFGWGFPPPSRPDPRAEEKDVYEPISVEVDRAHSEGDYRSYTIFFIGRLIRIVEAGHTTMRLYEWAELGQGRATPQGGYLGLTWNSPPGEFWAHLELAPTR